MMKPNINDRESLMQAWDSWVHYFKTNDTWGSWPRDAFESIIDAFYDRHDAVLSAARAVVDKYTDPYVYAVELDPEITALARAVEEVGEKCK